MASAAQFEANRLNAALSCGPKTTAGKANSSRNHLKFGLFSTRNYVRPEETEEYAKVSKALWKDLSPVGPVEELLAVEIVRASWRLHRCVVAEAEDGANPATQASVDRARASAHASLRRLLNGLRQFQSDRWLKAGPINQTNRSQSAPVAPAVSAAGEAPSPKIRTQAPPAPAIRTQCTPVASAVSAAGVGHPTRPAKYPAPDPRPLIPVPVPRNAPCPCHSGLKYKRCCGTAAPPVLTSRGAQV